MGAKAEGGRVREEERMGKETKGEGGQWQKGKRRAKIGREERSGRTPPGGGREKRKENLSS